MTIANDSSPSGPAVDFVRETVGGIVDPNATELRDAIAGAFLAALPDDANPDDVDEGAREVYSLVASAYGLLVASETDLGYLRGLVGDALVSATPGSHPVNASTVAASSPIVVALADYLASDLPDRATTIAEAVLRAAADADSTSLGVPGSPAGVRRPILVPSDDLASAVRIVDRVDPGLAGELALLLDEARVDNRSGLFVAPTEGSDPVTGGKVSLVGPRRFLAGFPDPIVAEAERAGVRALALYEATNDGGTDTVRLYSANLDGRRVVLSYARGGGSESFAVGPTASTGEDAASRPTIAEAVAAYRDANDPIPGLLRAAGFSEVSLTEVYSDDNAGRVAGYAADLDGLGVGVRVESNGSSIVSVVAGYEAGPADRRSDTIAEAVAAIRRDAADEALSTLADADILSDAPEVRVAVDRVRSLVYAARGGSSD